MLNVDPNRTACRPRVAAVAILPLIVLTTSDPSRAATAAPSTSTSISASTGEVRPTTSVAAMGQRTATGDLPGTAEGGITSGLDDSAGVHHGHRGVTEGRLATAGIEGRGQRGTRARAETWWRGGSMPSTLLGATKAAATERRSAALAPATVAEAVGGSSVAAPAPVDVFLEGTTGPAGGRSPCHTVFGYLPYWMSDATVRYDLLTHLACFSIEVNADGSLGNRHGWPWTAVIDRAHANGVRVSLVTTLFGADALEAFLTSPTARQRFIDAIAAELIASGVDGLNLDFEGFEHSDWVPHLPGFMVELGSRLYPQIPGLEITIATPAVDWSGRWDFRAIADACDGLFIMGYDYYGSWSNTSGACAPLIGPYTSVTETVREEYAAVLSHTPDKLILGTPWYGNDWTTTTSAAYAPVVRWNEHPYYREAMEHAGRHGPIQWDPQSETSWIRWYDAGAGGWRQVWFDSAESLGRKFDLALNEGLGGVGMWALGYDGGRTEIWDEVEDRVAAACLHLTDPTPGQAGVVNRFDIRGARPGATVHLAWSDAHGVTPVAACSGLSLRIGPARVVGAAVADASGLASLNRLVPAAARNRTVLFQAVEPATCLVSNIRTFTFRP